MSKNGRLVIPTLHKYSEDLVRQYHQSGFTYSRQKLGDELDNIFARAGLTNVATKIKFIGSKQQLVKEAKGEMIGFHAGRRFYARILADLGLPPDIVRDELDHKPKSMTDLYTGSPDHRVRVEGQARI